MPIANKKMSDFLKSVLKHFTLTCFRGCYFCYNNNTRDVTRPQPHEAEAEATTHEAEAEATTHEAEAEATTHEAEAEAEATTHEAEAEAEAKTHL